MKFNGFKKSIITSSGNSREIIEIEYKHPKIIETKEQLEILLEERKKYYEELKRIDNDIKIGLGKLVYYLPYGAVAEWTGITKNTLLSYFKIFLSYMEKKGYKYIKKSSTQKGTFVKNGE